MLYTVISYIWPDLTKEEMKKFSLLTVVFFLIIQSYWILRITRDTLFMTVAFPESLGWPALQGAMYQPIAKMLTVLVIAVLVGLYARLVDLYARHQLFYILCSVYALLFFLFFLVFSTHSFLGSFSWGWMLLALVGWLVYFCIESAGSLLISLFWSYVVSLTNTDTAKIGFPMILTGGQLGAITGSFIVYWLSSIAHVSFLFLPVVLNLFLVIGLIYFIRLFILQHEPSAEPVGFMQPDRTTVSLWGNFTEGLSLIVTRSYLRGIIVLSTVYEVVAVIVEYQMNRQALLLADYAHAQGYAGFQSLFGMVTNSISFFIILLGTGYLMKKYGLFFCLLVYPCLLGIILSGVYFLYSAQVSSEILLWAFFSATVMIKALSFSVHEPSKQILYIPTSKDVQFKAKSWIDTFGLRFSKMAGAQITNFFKRDLALLLQHGTLMSIVFVFCGAGAAFFVGRKNQQLLAEHKIID